MTQRRRAGLTLAAVFALLAGTGAVVSTLASRTNGHARPAPPSTTIPAPSPGPAGLGARDAFDRPDGGTGLGEAESGQRWVEIAGTWGVVEGEAHVTAPASGRRSIAVVETGSSDGTVQATMTAPAGGAGIVFRYHDPFNYWLAIAAPKVATWNVLKVVDGTLTRVGNVGLAATTAGTTISVDLSGRRIELFINGRHRLSIDDRDLMGASRAGLVVAPETATVSRWDGFVAVARARQPSAPSTTTSTTTTAPKPTTTAGKAERS